MSRQFEVVDSPVKLREEIAHIEDAQNIVLADLEGGLINFSKVIFGDVSASVIFAQKQQREAEGIGPHFDVHDDLVDNRYPFVGVFNLSGENKVRAVKLPDELAKIYRDTFPDADDAAYDARRHFGAIAFEAPNADVVEGRLSPGMGLVIPQGIHATQIVHEVTPLNPSMPGEFIKLTIPSREEAKQTIMNIGYVCLDELVTRGLSEGTEAPQIGAIKFGHLGITTVSTNVDKKRRPLRDTRTRRSSGLID